MKDFILKVANFTLLYKSQQHLLHILNVSPFPFLTGLFLATLLVPLTFSMHGVDLLGLPQAEIIHASFFGLPWITSFHARALRFLVSVRNLWAETTVSPLFVPLFATFALSAGGVRFYVHLRYKYP